MRNHQSHMTFFRKQSWETRNKKTIWKCYHCIATKGRGYCMLIVEQRTIWKEVSCLGRQKKILRGRKRLCTKHSTYHLINRANNLEIKSIKTWSNSSSVPRPNLHIAVLRLDFILMAHVWATANWNGHLKLILPFHPVQKIRWSLL